MFSSVPTQSAVDCSINPTTGKRYGIKIGTGIYEKGGGHNVSHPIYTIRDSNFKRTGPSSGQGIHAQQYHGRPGEPVSVGNIAHARKATRGEQRIDPNVKARVAELETEPNSWEGRFLQEKLDRAREAEREMESEHRRECELRRGYEKALAAGKVGRTK